MSLYMFRLRLSITPATCFCIVFAGTIYLFGKVKNEATGVYESCCVTVNNIERCLFFLPREKRVQRGHATGVPRSCQAIDPLQR
jgi:hypothetical protein